MKTSEKIARAALALALSGSGLAACAHAAPGDAPAVVTDTPVPRLSLAQLRETFGDAQSRYRTVQGIEVHYKDEGPRDAPVLLMVHGSQSTLKTWDRIAERLKDRYRIVRYDVAPFGLTGSIPDEVAATLDPAAVAEDLLSALGIARVTAVGVSSGGTLGMYLAARRPDMVERLVVSNTPSDPVVTDYLVMPPAFLAAQARQKANGVADRVFWDEYLSFFAGDPARIDAAKRAEYYDFNRRVAEPNLLAGTARIGDGVRATAVMAKVTAPTLLIWGGADPLLPLSAADAIERYLKNAPRSRVVMPDVGHYPPVEAPDRFATLLAAWLEAGETREALDWRERKAAQ